MLNNSGRLKLLYLTLLPITVLLTMFVNCTSCQSKESRNRLVFGPGVIQLSECIVLYKGNSKYGTLLPSDKNFKKAKERIASKFLGILNKNLNNEEEKPAEYCLSLSSLHEPHGLSNLLISIPLCESTLGPNFANEIDNLKILFPQ